jgi:hypothetical protein
MADSQKPKIRKLMPSGFVAVLAERTGLTDPAAISKLVNLQQHTSKHWPAVLQLAQETDPVGFAAWEAAHAVAA